MLGWNTGVSALERINRAMAETAAVYWQEPRRVRIAHLPRRLRCAMRTLHGFRAKASISHHSSSNCSCIFLLSSSTWDCILFIVSSSRNWGRGIRFYTSAFLPVDRRNSLFYLLSDFCKPSRGSMPAPRETGYTLRKLIHIAFVILKSNHSTPNTKPLERRKKHSPRVLDGGRTRRYLRGLAETFLQADLIKLGNQCFFLLTI